MTEMHTMHSHSASRSHAGELDWSSSPPSSGAIASLHGEGGGAFDGPMGGSGAAPTGGAAAGSSAPGVPSFFSSPFASVGVEYGKTLLRDNSLLSGGLGGWLRGSRLRFYFRVSQQSTRRKIGKLLLPYIHSDWRRQVTDESDAGLLEAGAAATGDSTSVSFQPPSADLNAPDLYLGSMAFVTFVVTMGFAMGSLNQFDPELIGMTATRSLVSLMLEVGCISALFYLSDAPQSPALLDLLSLCSYKYVALNIDILVGIIFGPTPFWIVFFALAVSTAVFMLRTLNGWLPSSGAAVGSSPSSPRFRTMMLVSAALQLAFSLFLLFPALPAVNASRGLSGLMSVARAETQPGGMLGPSSAAAAAAAAAGHESLPVPPVVERATPPLPAPAPAAKPATAEPAAPAAPEAEPEPPVTTKPAEALAAKPAPASDAAAAFEPTKTDSADAKPTAAASVADGAVSKAQSGRPARPANRRPPSGVKDKGKGNPKKEATPASKS